MQKYFVHIISFLILLPACLIAQQVRVTGFVTDSLSHEKLIGAYITESGTINGTIADNNGYFSIVIKPTSSLKFSFLGYKSFQTDNKFKNDTL